MTLKSTKAPLHDEKELNNKTSAFRKMYVENKMQPKPKNCNNNCKTYDL